MANIPALFKSATTPFRGRGSASPKEKSLIPRNGSMAPVPKETLASVYDSGPGGDPGLSFGPGTPPMPMPLDDTGQPRRRQYRVGGNLISNPGEGRLDYELTQGLVDNYDLLRQAIYIRTDEIACMDWDIVPDPLIARSVKDKRDLQAANRDKITAARLFFKKPDRVNTFQIWVRNLLEDHFVFDAMTLYKRRTYGGRLYSLEYLDGGLIKPLTNTQGRLFDPPETAYQQYMYGRPVFDFTRDELIYAPKNVRPRSVYGFSIVEQFLLHINLALRFQAWNTAFFTDGNIPSRLLTAPENWTADKIEEWQQLFDALIAGDPAAQRKLFMVPPGVTEIGGGNEGMFQYALEFSNYLIDITCVASGVTRQELGLEPGNSEGLGGSGLHDAMESVHNRRLVRLATFLADVIFTPLLQEEFGLDNFVWTWPSLEAQDPQAHAELNQLLLFSGQKSFDEILMEQGQEPVGIGRMINLGGKLLFEKDLLQLQESGTLAFEQQQLAEQQQIQNDGQKELAEHQMGLQQQQAEHQAGLQQQQSEFEAGLTQQTAEHSMGLQQQQAEHQSGLQQQTAEHAAGLQSDQLNQQADIQRGQMEQQGDMDMAAADHNAQLTTQQIEQQAQIAAQQSATQHQYSMVQGQAAAGYAQQQAVAQYNLRMGLPVEPPLQAPPPTASPAAGQPAAAPGMPGMGTVLDPNDPQSLMAFLQSSSPAAQPGAAAPGPAEEPEWFTGTGSGSPAPGAEATNPEQGPPDQGPGTTDPEWLTKSAAPDPAAVVVELEQWRRKVEKGIKAGKSPARVPFTPNFLTPDQTAVVVESLNKLAQTTPAALRALFRDLGPAVAKAGAAKYEYGSTQLNLPDPIAARIKRLAAAIPDSDLAAKGREDTPHITVQYGLPALLEEDIALLRARCRHHGPVELTLGETTVFKTSDTGADYDVLMVPVHGESLLSLRHAIRTTFPVTDTHPDYQPHITVAYIKPDAANKYVNDPALYGDTVTIDALTLSATTGDTHKVALA